MEGEVAPPIFLHHPHPIRFNETLARKRGFPLQNPNFSYQHQPPNNWNPNHWEWDSIGLSAKPSPKTMQEAIKAPTLMNSQQGDDESLSLKLGAVEEVTSAARPSKRVRAGLPGGGDGRSYPMCQVDGCGADLTEAKDYHRRHKVCEVHSKTTNVLVGKQMQRFCQQCSRFHLLSEFDEGKRSCRRRLAGHNRRRRKTLPENVPSKPHGITGSTDIVSLLSVLAKLQGTNVSKPANIPSDKEYLMQILGKINSLKDSNQNSRSFDLNVSLDAQQDSFEEAVPTAADSNSHIKSPQILSSGGYEHSPLHASDNQFQEVRQKLPFQLFGSVEDDSPPKLASSMKYFSSESSNPMDDISPSSSPPVAHNLISVQSAAERKHERTSIWWEEAAVEASTSRERSTPLDLFKEPKRRADNANYASSSVSDQSASSSNSDAQDRTGRIIFKLFDKDPSHIPATLRTQIINWLSHSPSEMESYIRPGCVVLSLYVSMPSGAWNDLEEDLVQRVASLVHGNSNDFWSSGRFLVRTSRKLASHKEGKVRICKLWRTWSAPELISVSPLAVISGQETSLVLRGRNLTIPGTKIHCTYNGGYISKEVLGSAYPGTMYDDSTLETFNLPAGPTFGRCFIEVENGFKGNCFPLIFANSAICQELRSLETELNTQPSSTEGILHFLNELGWVFQQKDTSTTCLMEYSCLRFKLLLTFSIERDWCNLIRMLLDLLVERSLKSDALAQESLEMLHEIQLLSRAVKRKCRKMVDLLLNYYIVRGKTADNASKVYIFLPNAIGPGGLTPLHLAASAQDSEDIIDALTNDPQEIGLKCWNSIHDNNGFSPSMYASLRNTHSYNKLVTRKLADRNNNQISIHLENDKITANQGTGQALEVRSCAQCVLVEKTRNKRIVPVRGLLARPYVHSMLAIAAVCVCVCLFFRGSPQIGSIAPFKWENLEFGPQ